ncbi:MAG: hypothetical protein WDN30_02260 [Pararobbsia sp.]
MTSYKLGKLVFDVLMETASKSSPYRSGKTSGNIPKAEHFVAWVQKLAEDLALKRGSVR